MGPCLRGPNIPWKPLSHLRPSLSPLYGPFTLTKTTPPFYLPRASLSFNSHHYRFSS